jgi:hypothetical protein
MGRLQAFKKGESGCLIGYSGSRKRGAGLDEVKQFDYGGKPIIYGWGEWRERLESVQAELKMGRWINIGQVLHGRELGSEADIW